MSTQYYVDSNTMCFLNIFLKIEELTESIITRMNFFGLLILLQFFCDFCVRRSSSRMYTHFEYVQVKREKGSGEEGIILGQADFEKPSRFVLQANQHINQLCHCTIYYHVSNEISFLM